MSTNKKIDPRKLKLKKERLRELSQDQLGQVNGGKEPHAIQATRFC